VGVGLKRNWGFAATLCAFLLAFAMSAPAAGATDIDSLPMHFSIVASGKDCPGCVIINASGEIVDDTSRDFAAFVSQKRLDGVLPPESNIGETASAGTPKVIIAFESVGGKVQSALIIGRRIRKSGWITVVGQAHLAKRKATFVAAGCYSACTMVMLGGTNRFVIPGSKVGIHQFSPQFGDGETFDAQEMNQIVRDYGREVVSVYDFVRAMGVNEDFFLATLRTPFNSLDVLPSSQWISTGVATAVLPDTTDDTPIAAILEAAGRTDQTASIATPVPSATITNPPPQTVAVADPTAAEAGIWTVAHTASGPASAQFANNDLRVSLVCEGNKTARLDLSFRDLAPVDLERMRAAAFSAKMLKVAGTQVPIDSVASPTQGEQSIAALVDISEIKAMPASNAITFAVLNKAGEPVGRASTIPTTGVARAIVDAMAACGA
jgi:hypothetical protein